MRKKRTRTRRGKALRWAVLMAVLLLVSNALGIIHLLPGQALRRAWQREGIQQAEIIHAEWATTTPGHPKRIYLYEFDDFVLMASANWNLLNGGWYASGDGTILDKNDPEQYHTHWMSSRNEMIVGCAVGFVPEGEDVPELWLRFREWDRDEYGRQKYYGEPVVIQPQTIVPVDGGNCYLAQFRIPQVQTQGIYTYPGVELVY